MKPIRSPGRWALLTILLGLGVAHQFFRKSATAEKEPTANADGAKPASTSSWFADWNGEASSGVVAVQASVTHPADSTPIQAAEELTYGNRPISLPDWAPPRSHLDELMAEERASGAQAVQLEDLQRIKPWLPEPQPDGDSGRQSRASDVVSLDSSADQERRWSSDSVQVASQAAGLLSAWPDEHLLPGDREQLLAEAGMHEDRTHARSALVDGPVHGGPQHRPAVGRATIRAGPAAGDDTQLGRMGSFGDSLTKTVAVPTASSSSAIFRSGVAQPYSQIGSNNMRAEVADRKKRYVYQPGYRPDD